LADALILQSEVGWHVTEVERFAREGEIGPATAAQKEQGIAGVLVVEDKAGQRTAAA
jgi:hypothetical protein